MSAPVWACLALLGLLAGIAARAVVWYLAVDRPPRRICPACGTAPRRALAPVRPLTGRCPHCAVHAPPLVLVPELLGVAGFLLAGWVGGGVLRVIAVCWLLAFAVPAVLVDARVQRLPDVLTWPCLAGVAAFSIGQAASSGAVSVAVRTALAGAAVAALFLLLALTADVGLGDLKISASLGAVLGYLSWHALIAGLAAGFCFAGLQAVALALRRRRGWSTRIALGPALLTGTVLVLAIHGG